MKDLEWMKEMYCRAKSDKWCTEMQNDIEKFTPAFLTIRESLSPELREQLDLYIGSCEEYEHSLTRIAYQLGKESQGLQ